MTIATLFRQVFQALVMVTTDHSRRAASSGILERTEPRVGLSIPLPLSLLAPMHRSHDLQIVRGPFPNYYYEL